jgi:hypothetical protein
MFLNKACRTIPAEPKTVNRIWVRNTPELKSRTQ